MSGDIIFGADGRLMPCPTLEIWESPLLSGVRPFKLHHPLAGIGHDTEIDEMVATE